MAIYAPGYRDRHNRRLGGGGKSAVAALSLTAMVDMFTVLVVFLLQNYGSGQDIFIPKQIKLPSASAVKELKPAHVVIISEEGLQLNQEVLVPLAEVKDQKDWMIQALYDKLYNALETEKKKREESVGNAIKTVVQKVNNPNTPPEDPNQYRKVTVQADKSMDFLTIKKIMYTVTEAGAGEINFAVIKTNDQVAKATTN